MANTAKNNSVPVADIAGMTARLAVKPVSREVDKKAVHFLSFGKIAAGQITNPDGSKSAISLEVPLDGLQRAFQASKLAVAAGLKDQTGADSDRATAYSAIYGSKVMAVLSAVAEKFGTNVTDFTDSFSSVSYEADKSKLCRLLIGELPAAQAVTLTGEQLIAQETELTSKRIEELQGLIKKAQQQLKVLANADPARAKAQITFIARHLPVGADGMFDKRRKATVTADQSAALDLLD